MNKLYSDSDIIAKIEDVFQFDNLFNLIKERDSLRSELFHPQFIANLEKDLHKWYSVAEAGRIIGLEKPIPPSSLKHYIDNLEEYILPEDAPSNKYVRLNYIALVKLRMVWLLKDELKITGLKTEVGILGSVGGINNRDLPVNSHTSRELQQYYAMTEVLFKSFMETGDDGRPRFKPHIQQVLNSNLLLEGQSSIVEELGKQKEVIDSLTRENENLRKRIEENEELTSSFNEKFDSLPGTLEKSAAELKETIDEEQKAKIEDSEKKLRIITETLRARSKAEREWEQKGALARAFGKRQEYVDQRVKEILNNKTSDED